MVVGEGQLAGDGAGQLAGDRAGQLVGRLLGTASKEVEHLVVRQHHMEEGHQGLHRGHPQLGLLVVVDRDN